MPWGSQTLAPKIAFSEVKTEDAEVEKKDSDLIKDEHYTCSSFDSLPVPPDGAYGWVVCFGAFMCMVILDGMLFSFGVFFLDLLEAFGESKGKTSWVGSTLMGTHLIMGPLTAVLVNLWDCRRVAVLGTLIAVTSFALSTLSPSLDILILLYGVCGGIGVSMVYIPAILIVGFYFEKKRALANGIANSGSGFGTFIYAPLSRLLLDEYSWRGGLLILAGIVFNCAVCAALFRPLVGNDSNSTWKLEGPYDTEETYTEVSNPTIDILKKQPKAKSLHDIPSTASPLGTLKRRPVQNNPLSFISSLSLKSPETARKYIACRGSKLYVSRELLKPMSRKDVFYSGSVRRLERYNDPDVPLSLSLLKIPSSKRSEDGMSETLDGQSIRELLHDMLGLGLLRSPLFLMCVGSGILWTTHSSVLSIFPDYAVISGIAKPQAALLVSTIGVTNIVGRLVAGYISDRPGVDPIWVNAASLFMGSAVTFAIPFTKVYAGLAFEAAIFGLCMGAWTSLRPIILVELLGLDRLTNAFGLMAMFQGIAFTVGSPITGTLYDYTKSYMVPFIVAGCAFFISGIFSLFMRRVGKLEGRHGRDDMEMDFAVESSDT